MPTTPKVECEIHHAGLAVSDITTAVDFYTNKLGFKLGFKWGDPPSYAGVVLGSSQMFLKKDTPNPQGCHVCFEVGNADELFEFQRANGVEVVEPPGDREYGIRDYAVRDLHGYTLVFGHNIFNVGPPIKVERVDLHVRVEKRMAALLHDLAEHKHMNLTSCLEEILLHTCEPYGEGVASPHTKTDLRFIQELKKKHGIDYDSHGSYRFVED